MPIENGEIVVVKEEEKEKAKAKERKRFTSFNTCNTGRHVFIPFDEHDHREEFMAHAVTSQGFLVEIIRTGEYKEANGKYEFPATVNYLENREVIKTRDAVVENYCPASGRGDLTS